jgi:hypothetical protein
MCLVEKHFSEVVGIGSKKTQFGSNFTTRKAKKYLCKMVTNVFPFELSFVAKLQIWTSF